MHASVAVDLLPLFDTKQVLQHDKNVYKNATTTTIHRKPVNYSRIY